MKRVYAILLYLTAVILGSFYSIFVKIYANSFIWVLFFYILSIYLFSLIGIAIETKGNSTEFKSRISKAFEGINPLLSSGSLISSFNNIFGVKLLPIMISSPLRQLKTASSLVFDVIINNYKPKTTDIISVIILILGSIVVNMDVILKYTNSKSSKSSLSTTTYIIGISSIMIYVILSGLLYTLYYDDARKESALTTLNIRSTVGLIIISIILGISILLNYIKVPPALTLFIIFIGTLIFGATSIYITYYDFKNLKETDTIILNTGYVLFTVLWSMLLFKEKLTLFKGIGLSMIVSGSLVGLL